MEPPLALPPLGPPSRTSQAERRSSATPEPSDSWAHRLVVASRTMSDSLNPHEIPRSHVDTAVPSAPLATHAAMPPQPLHRRNGQGQAQASGLLQGRQGAGIVSRCHNEKQENAMRSVSRVILVGIWYLLIGCDHTGTNSAESTDAFVGNWTFDSGSFFTNVQRFGT